MNSRIESIKKALAEGASKLGFPPVVYYTPSHLFAALKQAARQAGFIVEGDIWSFSCMNLKT